MTAREHWQHLVHALLHGVIVHPIWYFTEAD